MPFSTPYIKRRLAISDEWWIEINSFADIPSGTGLGSSSAFTVAVLLNLFTRQSQFIDQETLANNACEIEIDRLKEPIGKQDQYASAIGGLNTLTFNKNRSVGVSPIHLNESTYKTLENNLLLFLHGQTAQRIYHTT